MGARWPIAIVVLAGAGVIGWLSWRSYTAEREVKEESKVTVIKEPEHYTNRTFDPASPPADMPALSVGEVAECDSNFIANVGVGGQPQQTDATHGTVTVTHVNVRLKLELVVWTPEGVTPRVMEHEQGHRQIAEYFYRNADKVAERIAARYMGRQIEISGSDLAGESDRAVEQIATEITEAYKRELNPGPTQVLYDDITDHSRNDVVVKEAVEHAIKNAE